MRHLCWFSIIALSHTVFASVVPRISHGGLHIQIEHLKDTRVRATIKNTGTKSLRLLKDGTILDKAPVEKLHIHNRSRFSK
jgi:hypothetical protein